MCGDVLFVDNDDDEKEIEKEQEIEGKKTDAL